MSLKSTSLNIIPVQSLLRKSLIGLSWKSLLALFGITAFLLFGSGSAFGQASPVFTTCPGNPSVTLPAGNGGITLNNTNIPSILGVAAVDPDGGTITYSAVPSTISCIDAGNVLSITVTADDGVDTPTDCPMNTLIVDGGPLALCKDTTIYLDMAGTAQLLSPAEIDDGSNACTPIALYEIEKNGGGFGPGPISFDCTDVAGSPHTATLRVTDSQGPPVSSTCEATVIVLDTFPPTLTCPGNLIAGTSGGADAVTGNCDADMMLTHPTPTDACSTPTLTIAFSNGSPAPAALPTGGTVTAGGMTTYNFAEGETVVTYTASDDSGNMSTCSFTVTITDDEQPTTGCMNISVALDPSGSYTLSAADSTTLVGTSDDNCGFTATFSQSTFDCTDIGANTITITFDDGTTTPVTCMPTVTVLDSEAPVITCPTPVTQTADPGVCDAFVDFSANLATATDNCPANLTITNDYNTGGADASDTYPLGTTLVTFTVSDGTNTDNCTIAVTITDDEPPTISNCPPISAVMDTICAVTNSGTCATTVGWINPSAADACNGIASFTTTALDPDSNPIIITVGSAPPTPPCTDITLFAGYYSAGEWTATGTVDSTSAPASVELQEGSSFAITVEYDGVISFDWSKTFGGGSFSYDLNGTTITLAGITIFPPATGSVEIPVSAGDMFTLIQGTGFSSSETTISNFAFTCAAGAFGDFPVGVSSVTYEATDNEGNTETCTFYVKVTDAEAPTAVCQDITVQLDASGNASILPTAVDGGSTDNCGIDTRTLSNSTFDCDSVGVRTVELYVTDMEGNADTCTANVTVQDNVAPTAVCQNITIQLDATGNATITPAQIDNGSSDACGIMSLSLSQTAFDCSHVGNNLVTLTVTDNNGNTSTCNAQVTVQDVTAPIASCQDITVQLDAGGNVSITGADIDGGSTDACGIASLNASPNAFNCSNVGANTVTLTVIDNNGNTATCTSTVTVQDNVNPTVTCQDITVQLDGAGTASIAATALVNSSNDNCGINTTTASQTTFTCADLGANTVTVTVTDVNGNTGTCTATVTVEDNVAPSITCPSNLTRDADGTCMYTASGGEFDATTTDNCSATVSHNYNGGGASLDGETFPLGSTNVTWTATDPSGNSVTCNITIVVEDNTDPVLTTPGDFTQSVDPGQCDAVVTFATSATDNCDASVDIVCVPPSGSTFPVGPTTVTCTATDDAGNTDVSTFVVTVNETEAPVAVCQDITVQLDASGTASITAGQIDNGSTDNCGISTISVAPNAFTCADTGANTVTLTVTDAAGNSSTCTATVTVQDNIAPTITCPADITVSATAGCDAAVTLNLATATDNCSAVITNDFNAGGANASGTYPLGLTVVTFTATDPSGNSVTCNMTVTVEDNTAPSITCPANITVSAGPTCATFVTVPAPTIVDGDGCGFTVTNNYNATANASDTYPVGTTSVIWTVTDPSGNSSACTMTVTVVDNTPPTQTGGQVNGDTISVPAMGGGCSATVTWTAPTFTDNCLNPVVPVSTHTPGSTFPVGTHLVEYTATDPSGNTTVVSFTVIVSDGVAPVAGCQPNPINLTLNGSGTVTLTALMVNLGSFDNCAIFSYEISVFGSPFAPSYTFDCTELGTHTVTLQVSDGVLTDQCTATVIVTDNIAPTANCQDITVSLDAAGNASITASQIDNAMTPSSDNGTCLTLSIDNSSFDCSDIGDNTVTLTVTDAGGNSDACTATVTVEDNLAPIIDPLSVPANTTIACGQSIPGDPGTVTATDNCDVPVIIFNQTSTQSGNPNACSNYSYTVTQTWTATDNSSNSSSASRTITVVDNAPPSNPTYNATVANGGTISTNPNDCFATITLDLTDLDDCAPYANLTITNTAPMGDGMASASGNYGIGTYNFSFTAADPCGNASTFNYSFTVVDNVPPVASCVNNLNLGLPASGILVLSAGAVNSGSFDNCGVISMMTVSPDTFTCADVGMTIPVTLTVTDDAGNSSSCNTSVTIQENNNPTALCQPVTLTLDGNGMASLNASQVDAGSFDDCTPVTLTVSPNSFDESDLGNNTVTLTVTDDHGNSSTCLANVTVVLPPTCFHIGDVAGGAGNVVSVPVTSEDFTGLVGFQMLFEISSDAGMMPVDGDSIGEFIGVSGIHPDVSSVFQFNLLADSLFTPVDTTYLDELDGMGNPVYPPLDSIDMITYDTSLFYNTLSVSWVDSDPSTAVNLPDGTELFNLDILLTGDLGESSPIVIDPTSSLTPLEITQQFGGNLFPGPGCWTPGSVEIGELIISGNIRNENGNNIALVDVNLFNTPFTTPGNFIDDFETTTDGNYSFTVISGGNFDIDPEKTINWPNGVDILDVAGIQRHAVNFAYVNSAYKKIAADVSGDRSITTFDAVQLNLYLSGGFTGTPPPTPSWQFVDAAQMLPNDPNASVPPFDSTITLLNVISDSPNNDFIAVKTGDIAGNPADTAAIIGNEADHLSDTDLEFIMNEQAIKANEAYSFEVRANNFNQLIGYQLVLNFDPEVLTYTGFENGTLENLGTGNFGQVMLDEGKLIMTWYNAYATDAKADEVLFKLNFVAKRNAERLSSLLSVTELPLLQAVAYNEAEIPRDIDLIFNAEQKVSGEFALYQNTPNPFKDETVISFNLPESTFASLRVMDVTGKVVYLKEQAFDQGYNEVNLSKSDIPTSGIMFYELVTPKHTASKQMIIIE